MCKSTNYIKLCTCGEGKIDRSRCWQITRKDPNGEIVTGLIVPPTLTITAIYLERKLLEDLNNCDVFDFDYDPECGDIIQISLDGKNFAYEYTGTEFTTAPIDYGFRNTLYVAEGAVRF